MSFAPFFALLPFPTDARRYYEYIEIRSSLTDIVAVPLLDHVHLLFPVLLTHVTTIGA